MKIKTQFLKKQLYLKQCFHLSIPTSERLTNSFGSIIKITFGQQNNLVWKTKAQHAANKELEKRLLYQNASLL